MTGPVGQLLSFRDIEDREIYLDPTRIESIEKGTIPWTFAITMHSGLTFVVVYKGNIEHIALYCNRQRPNL